MDANARLDGFMVHPLDLFPTNKNLISNNLSKISTNTANLDGFTVHPIDMFVSHDNHNNNYNYANNLTQNYEIFDTQQNYNNIYPYVQPNNETNIFNLYQTPKNIQIYESKMQPTSFPTSPTIYNYNTTIQTSNQGQPQNYNNVISNPGITYNTIQTITSTQNPVYPQQSVQNLNNYNYFQQNSTFNNQNNIIQLPSTTVQNVTNVKRIYENYNQPPIEINKINPINQINPMNPMNPYKQNYNTYTTTQQMPQNYTLFNDEKYITPKIQTTLVNSEPNYYPNQITNITNINYQPPTPPIQSYQINQINNRVPMDSAPKNNNINIIQNQNLDNKIPYNTESYEPDAVNIDYPANTATFNNMKAYFTSSINPVPTNTRVYSVPKTINKINTTIIVPTKKSIIVPTRKTVIIPKKTTVIIPKIQRSIIPIPTAPTTPTKQSLIRNYQPVFNNNLSQLKTNLIPITKTLIPLNPYNSHTINTLSRPLSHINNYNQRTFIPNNTGVIVPPKNQFSIVSIPPNQRAISTSPITYKPYSALQNNPKFTTSKISNLQFGRIIYRPRNFK